MIKAIVFDLGGVLFTNGTKKFIAYISDVYHVNKKIVEEVLDGDIGSKYRTNKISDDEFWRLAIDRLGIHAGRDELEKKWIEGYELISGTKELILQLRKKYKIYFLSDNVHTRATQLNNRYHFVSLFDGGIFSHEVGIRKPNPTIYHLLLKKACVKASEAIYIDDKYECTEPAAKLGCTTFVFESVDKLKEDLNNIGI